MYTKYFELRSGETLKPSDGLIHLPWLSIVLVAAMLFTLAWALPGTASMDSGKDAAIVSCIE